MSGVSFFGEPIFHIVIGPDGRLQAAGNFSKVLREDMSSTTPHM